MSTTETNPDHLTSAECLAALSRADIEPRPDYKCRVWARYCRLNGFPEPTTTATKTPTE